MELPTTICVMRVSDGPSVVPGAVQLPCSQCGELCHVSPSSQKMMTAMPTLELWCMQCIAPKVEADAAAGETSAFVMMPGTMEELKDNCPEVYDFAKEEFAKQAELN